MLSKRQSLKHLIIASLLIGSAPGAKAQFTISPGSATICRGQGSATFLINQPSYPLVESLDLSGIANYQSYAYAGSYPSSNYPARGAVTYAGVSFNVPAVNSYDSWNADAAAGFSSGTVSTTINIPCPKSVDKIYTLINTYWGQADTLTSLTLTFTNSTTVKIPLKGNMNIRDIMQHLWTNSYGSSTNNGFAISTQPVWNITYLKNDYRRDMQTITVPPAYSGLFLKSITITDAGNHSWHRAFLSGISLHATGAAPITWRQGSLTGPIVASGPAPTYQITVSPSTNTTYYAVPQGGACIQQTTVNVQICCSDTCFWKVTGNNVIGGNNIFGTLTRDNVQIQTSATNRGVLTSDGRMGWNTMTPSTLLHVLCGMQYKAPSDIRFEQLPAGRGRALVVDDKGYVYISNDLVGRPAGSDEDELSQLKKEVALLKQQVTLLTQNNSLNATSDIFIYPNPAKDKLDVRIFSDSRVAATNFTVVDMQGKLILSNVIPADNNGKEFSINISSLPPGIYVVNLVADNKVIARKKFVIEK